jgi:hypothetical protein
MPGGSSTLPPTFAGGSLSSGNNTGGVTNGQTGPPNRLGTVLPSGNNNNTGTPTALTSTKEHNTASPNVLSSTGNTGNPSTNDGQNQNQQTSEHHHKGEQNGEHPRMGIHKVAIQTIIHQVEGVITVKAITATIIKTVRNNNALGRPNLY